MTLMIKVIYNVIVNYGVVIKIFLNKFYFVAINPTIIASYLFDIEQL